MATFRATQAQAKAKAESRNRATPAQAAASAPTREKIAERAYRIWQASGCPAGRDQEHWLQAERELGSQPPPGAAR